MDVSISRRLFSSTSDIVVWLCVEEEVELLDLVERVCEEVELLCAASKSNIDSAIVFLGLVIVVGLDVIVDGGSDEAMVGGCSEDLQVSTLVCCLDGSSDDDGISSAVVLSAVFQFGLTMLENNTPSSLLKPPWLCLFFFSLRRLCSFNF